MKIYTHQRVQTQEAAEAAVTQQHQQGNLIARIIHLPPYIFPTDSRRFLVSNFIEEAA